MNTERLASIPTKGVALDLESHLIRPGVLAPEPVVASMAMLVDGKIEGELLVRRPDLPPIVPGGAVDDLLYYFEALLADDSLVLILANGVFDMLVAAAAASRRGRDLMPLIFDAYRRGRIYDVQIAEALHAIAYGALGKDPHTGGELKNPETGKKSRYSLAVCVKLVTGRTNAKSNDEFRERYAELESVPVAQWPPVAKIYPVDDTCNTFEVALGQIGYLPALQYGHVWNGKTCVVCGATASSTTGPCRAARPRRNLHDLAPQAYAHWAMHLGAAWGFHVDQTAVDALEARTNEGATEAARPFVEAGILWFDEKDGKYHETKAALKYRVAYAYGATQPCQTCGGHCTTCAGSGQVPGARAGKLKRCASCGGTGRPKKCEPCDGTGLDLTMAEIPRSDGGGIGCGRDPLEESGDEFLMAYAAYGENAKIKNVYIPFLRSGRVEVTGPDGVVRYQSIPLTLRPNVIVETGRTSYDGVVQLLPRTGGVRECIVARPPQYEEIEVPDGYVLQPGEEWVAPGGTCS